MPPTFDVHVWSVRGKCSIGNEFCSHASASMLGQVWPACCPIGIVRTPTEIKFAANA